MTKLREIGTFWVAGALGWMEVLSLSTMLARGHKVTLFSYGPVANLPEGVIWRDAREIFDTDRIFVHGAMRTPSAHSDIFRMKMFAQTDMVWMDLDFLLLRPLATEAAFIFAPEGPTEAHSIGNSVFRLPENSQTLARALEYFEGVVSGRRRYRSEMLYEDAPGGAFGSGLPAQALDMHIATFGPLLMNRLLKATGEVAQQMPWSSFYPFDASQLGAFVFRSFKEVWADIPKDGYGIHLWATFSKQYLTHRSAFNDTERLMNSFLIEMCRKYRVNFLTLPCEHPRVRIGRDDGLPIAQWSAEEAAL
ncbi:MAG: hypothetical protein Q4F71_00210 [Paracoccus sp. (in: a-proteobacteria)]|nr:hypothetical protein [Paracoccus sp. (in: a-proteobacteria)]